jgi:hypothetical protein
MRLFRLRTVQAGYFISFAPIYRCMAGTSAAALLSTMMMSSHGCRVSLPSPCLHGEVIFGRPQVKVDKVLDLCKERLKRAQLPPNLVIGGFQR